MRYQFPIFSDHKALKSPDKIAEHNPRVQRWLEFFTADNYTLEYRKGGANGNADFLSRLPLPATELDRSGPRCLTPSNEERVFLIRSNDLLLGGTSAYRLGWAGAPRPKLWLRWAHALPSPFSIVLQKRAEG